MSIAKRFIAHRLMGDLGFGAADYQLRQMALNLHSAYQMLGVDHRVGDAELKLAYRRLMSRHHPDKLAADGDAEQARHASENSVAIRNALRPHPRESKRRLSQP